MQVDVDVEQVKQLVEHGWHSSLHSSFISTRIVLPSSHSGTHVLFHLSSLSSELHFTQFLVLIAHSKQFKSQSKHSFSIKSVFEGGHSSIH